MLYSVEHLKELCNKNMNVEKIHGIRIDTVVKKTVRTKGQVYMERFFYMREGVQKFTLESGEEIIAKKGDIVYLPPDVTYTSEWENVCEGKAMTLLFSMSDNSVISGNMFIVTHDKYGIYANLFLNLISNYEKGELGYKIKCRSIFWEIYHSILTDLLKTYSSKKDCTVNKGILYIENNYMKKIDVDELAKMCYTSPSTFRRKFIQTTGMTPIEYKNRLKIIKASELLKTGEYSVAEVAKEVNIDDIYYFSKIFKKYMGINPSSFKKS